MSVGPEITLPWWQKQFFRPSVHAWLRASLNRADDLSSLSIIFFLSSRALGRRETHFSFDVRHSPEFFARAPQLAVIAWSIAPQPPW